MGSCTHWERINSGGTRVNGVRQDKCKLCGIDLAPRKVTNMAEFVVRFQGRVTSISADDAPDAAARTVRSWLVDRDNDADRGRSYELEVAEIADGSWPSLIQMTKTLNEHGVRYVVDVAAKRGRGSVTARPIQ